MFASRLLIAALAILLPVLACAETDASLSASGPDISLTQRYPAGSIASTDAAEQALTDVSRERAAIETRYASEQSACYDKFFVSTCLEKAKERRRKELLPLRDIENEAKRFQRRARVEERDKALEERRVQDEAEEAERRQRAAEAAERSAKAAEKSAKPMGPTGTPDPGRVARHAEKLKRIEAEEAAMAKQREENVAAYRRKIAEAEAHRKEVERKKAEKAQERALRQNEAAPGK